MCIRDSFKSNHFQLRLPSLPFREPEPSQKCLHLGVTALKGCCGYCSATKKHMYRWATGAHCDPLKKLRPPAADSFSDSMPAEAATVFSRDKGGRRYPKSRGQQAPSPWDGESWGVANGSPSVDGPENKLEKQEGGNRGPAGCYPQPVGRGRRRHRESLREPENIYHT